MRIAFITYEYPPDIAKGGIATYVEQAARLLYERGNEVEVFCGSYERNVSENDNGVWIHRCLVKDAASFKEDCLPLFSQRHLQLPFNIIESPEIHADALRIKEKFPRLPMTVRLHMASFMQTRLMNFYTPRLAKLRYFLGGIRRGKINFYGEYDYKDDIEYQFTRLAEGVVAPSEAQKNSIAHEWHLPHKNIAVIPNPYTPPARLLNVSVSTPVEHVVTFIGKLNVHKGIVNLVKAIPIVARKHPDVLFRLIGNDSYFAVRKMNMSDYIRKELAGYEKNYHIMGGLEYDEVQENIATSAVCIFPSLWECFGLVCLEAMSAARPVIGSSEGGMKDILSEGAGLLVDPHSIKDMANAVMTLLGDEKLRRQYGNAGREKVLRCYNAGIIGKEIEDHYLGIITGVNKNLLIEQD